MKKVIYSVLFFLLFGVLLASLNYKWFVPKITTISYTIESSQIDTLEVFYNLGEGWSRFQKQKHINQVGTENNHEYIFSLSKFPEQIRFDFGTQKDTIILSNISVSNNANIEFNPEKNFKRSIDIQDIKFISPTKIMVISKGGDPFIEFYSNAKNSYPQRFISLKWISGLVIFCLSLLLCFILLKVNLEFINLKNILPLVFLIFISLATSNQLFHFIPDAENLENRKLAPFPEFEKLDSYFMEFEEYLNDQFSLKPTFAYLDAIYKYTLFGVSSQPNKVIIGQNDYLFPVELEILKDYKHQTHFIPQGLQNILITLKERREWLKRKGIPLVVAFAPNKQTIYPEYMAKEYIAGQYIGRMDQLLNYIRTNSDLDIIDLRTTLHNQKKNNNALFYKHDMHWNNLGGFYGYQSIMEKAATYFPELMPYQINDFDTSTAFLNDGDQARLLLLHEKLLKQEVVFKPKFEIEKEKSTHYRGHINGNQYQVKGKKLKLVMFHDSYGVNLNPLISNHFNKSVFIWNHNFDTDLIEKEKPDIVIHEFAELFLPSLLTLNSVEMKKSLSNPDLK